VTLWTGPNDVIRGDDPEDFEGDLEDILAQLRDETDAVIVVANIPNLTELPRFRDEPDPDVTEDRIDAFNEAIGRQAGELDVPIVDLHEEGSRTIWSATSTGSIRTTRGINGSPRSSWRSSCRSSGSSRHPKEPLTS
jgi:lysophospholipase L1-like esterase